MTATSDGCASSTQENRLAAAGRAAVVEAAKLWQSDIVDPPRNDYSPRGVMSRHAINKIVHAGGWTWIEYRGDGDVEWCGLFVAACWRAAGIDPKWLASYFASTYRLDLWARYRTFNDKPNPRPAQGPHRLLAELGRESTSLPWDPRAGDILMIGDGQPVFGDHITLVESYDAERRVFNTIEGNGIGLGPDGKRRQGVVRAVRHLGGSGYCARRLIRPAPSDLL
jgi:hypothetical protein